MCSTLRSSIRCTAMRRESGDHCRTGRAGIAAMICDGRGAVVPYDQYSSPSVVSCVESPPAAGRTHRLCSCTNASVRPSGERTKGVRLTSVSPVTQS